jgi:hemerythrin
MNMAVQRFEWSDEYSVGIPQLDAQHRQIIDLLGEFKACVDGAEAGKLVAAALNKVNAYARFHLEREELLLRVRGYPEYAGHKAEHDAYRQKVATLQSQWIRRDIAIRIGNFLSEWWRYHILTSDRGGYSPALTSASRSASTGESAVSISGVIAPASSRSFRCAWSLNRKLVSFIFTRSASGTRRSP